MLPARDRQAAADPGTMTPMIDVVFLLLIFFIWTASFQISERLVPGSFASKSDPQGAGSPSTSVGAETELIVLQLRPAAEDSPWILNGRPLRDVEQLRTTLQEVASIDPQTPMIIDPDPQVPFGRAIEALDLGRTAGLAKVHFVAPGP